MNGLLPLYSVAQSRQLDQRAIEDFGVAGYTLMQRAAAAAYALAKSYWPTARDLVLLAGGGNNGGDAIEMARLAHLDGRRCHLFLVVDANALRGEAQQAWRAAAQAGVVLRPLQELPNTLAAADLVVDGLFGTGLSRAPAADMAAIIEFVNRAGKPVLSLDVPSGLSADAGSPLGATVRANLTISFITRKQGLFTGSAREFCGEAHFAGLDLPGAVFTGVVPAAWLLSSAYLAHVLPQRKANSHKGQHGHVLAIGGAPGMSGAIRLCGRAALRAGAGLVSVLTHGDSRVEVAQEQAELMVQDAESPAANQRFQQADVVAVGPGLGCSSWGRDQLRRALCSNKPLVLDADALNLLEPGDKLADDVVLTPHPGEAARLLGVSTAEIQADRLRMAQAIRAKYGGVVVLKGAGSVIAAEAGLFVCAAGNPGMAVAGMGDVLTGVIAALRAQGLLAVEAACAGVLAHALAGDVAAKRGRRGLLPSDVIEALRGVLNP